MSDPGKFWSRREFLVGVVAGAVAGKVSPHTTSPLGVIVGEYALPTPTRSWFLASPNGVLWFDPWTGEGWHAPPLNEPEPEP